ncbi:kh domain [Cyclospora cayetanensis]|uniref:Kh domain n=1 Tax=Cyclospora cayetanensis TaxID=88456 RepID=A0A1D3D4L5_9EIME|nr:kh domain [Cyclospora cayetanensis]
MRWQRIAKRRLQRQEAPIHRREGKLREEQLANRVVSPAGSQSLAKRNAKMHGQGRMPESCCTVLPSGEVVETAVQRDVLAVCCGQAAAVQLTPSDASALVAPGNEPSMLVKTIEMVSGCTARLDQSSTRRLQFNGQRDQLERALLLLRLVLQQRHGPLVWALPRTSAAPRRDLTVLLVPSSVAQYSTVRGALRRASVQWRIMAFVLASDAPPVLQQQQQQLTRKAEEGEEAQAGAGGASAKAARPVEYRQLLIFGEPLQRLGAALSVMNTLEMQEEGLFLRLPGGIALGSQGAPGAPAVRPGLKEGAVKRRLTRAAGAPIEFWGPYAVVGGSLRDRRRLRDFLRLLLRAEKGLKMPSLTEREDALQLSVPSAALWGRGLVVHRLLRDISLETGTLCLIEGEL